MAPPEPMSHREVRHRQARAIQRGMPRNSWMPVARLSLRQRSPGSLAEGRECLAAFFPVVLQSMSVLRGLCRRRLPSTAERMDVLANLRTVIEIEEQPEQEILLSRQAVQDRGQGVEPSEAAPEGVLSSGTVIRRGRQTTWLMS